MIWATRTVGVRPAMTKPTAKKLRLASMKAGITASGASGILSP